MRFLFFPLLSGLALLASGCQPAPSAEQPENLVLPQTSSSPIPTASPTQRPIKELQKEETQQAATTVSQSAPPSSEVQSGCTDTILAPYVAENGILIVPAITAEGLGKQVCETVVTIDGVTIPGVTEQMGAPNISGPFDNDTLAIQEMRVCDRLAVPVKPSCRPIPPASQNMVAQKLIQAFTRLKSKIWRAASTAPSRGNRPLGITNTS